MTLHRPMTFDPNVPGGVQSSGMAEICMGSPPQVFVVDSQASYVSVPMGRKPRWARASQKFLLLLVVLVVFGLVVQGCLIHNLYKKMEAFSLCVSHPLCHNLSDPVSAGLQGGIIQSPDGSEESNEISTEGPDTEPAQQRPFAHLMGSSVTVDQNKVVQWMNDGGETIKRNMGYSNGRLLVKKDGYYYLYSKVTMDAKDDCSLIQHEVLKNTKAYGKPIQLMKSKRVHCWSSSPSGEVTRLEDLTNSFLAGIFHLQSGDEVFVKLDGKGNQNPAPADNLMGAFMIFP
uniref:tumor necrosis factor ligand superfamily member 14-like isoform X1 n=2 Tax=Semicossyphus pulcher TaxID=241346 RepID=UPI0037E98E99